MYMNSCCQFLEIKQLFCLMTIIMINHQLIEYKNAK